MPLHRRTTSALSALALAAGALLCSAAAPPPTPPPTPGPTAPPGTPPPPLPCPEGATCATITVPLDRHNPAAGTTHVGYALIRHRDTSRPAAGTIAPNPGGPGGSTVGTAPLWREILGPLLDDHDLLLMDPRGVGMSDWLDCDVRKDVLALPPAPQVRELGRCARSIGERRRYYTSAAVADDLDDLRARLGIPRLKLFGESYGTYLMTVYAQRHPQRVQTSVLSGAYPLAFDPWERPSVAAVRRAIRLVCRRDGGCDGERVLSDLRRFAAQLRRHPIPFEVTINGVPRRELLDETMLAMIVFVAGEEPEIERWGEFPRRLREALHGNPNWFIDTARETLVELSDITRAGRLISLAMQLSVECNDYPHASDLRAPYRTRIRQFERGLATLPRRQFDPFSPRAAVESNDETAWCLLWPEFTGRTQSTARPTTSAPVLVLSGDLDTNTTSSNGVAAARQYRNAKWIEVPNSGHTPDDEPTGCVRGIIRTFLRDQRTGDTGCLSRIPPGQVLGQENGPDDRRAAAKPR
ncbi:alpha/beta hydrolase [Nonomuraea jabiensis]|uniref:alpha/beta hydrolase n=1 Tax=Nonomuraea jabiensis TaxID=882448 RepID=UPI0036AA6262